MIPKNKILTTGKILTTIYLAKKTFRKLATSSQKIKGDSHMWRRRDWFAVKLHVSTELWCHRVSQNLCFTCRHWYTVTRVYLQECLKQVTWKSICRRNVKSVEKYASKKNDIKTSESTGSDSVRDLINGNRKWTRCGGGL